MPAADKPAGREKLKCIYLFPTTYNWKSLTFCTRTLTIIFFLIFMQVKSQTLIHLNKNKYGKGKIKNRKN